MNNIDILICNVGSGNSAKPGEEEIRDWEEMFSVNFYSAVNVIEAARECLIKSKGVIIYISSICGSNYIKGAPITYSTSKAALNSYIKLSSKPFGKFGVRINACPTIRTADKIALSTRNKLLNKKSLEKASKIAKLLIKIKKRSKLHSSKFKLDLSDYKIELENKFNIKIDYLEFRDEKNLKLNNRKNKLRLFVAYNINGVRLIDNF